MKNYVFEMRNDKDFDLDEALNRYEKIIQLTENVKDLDYIIKKLGKLSKSDCIKLLDNDVFSITFELEKDEIRIMFTDSVFLNVKRMCDSYLDGKEESFILDAIGEGGIRVCLLISHELGIYKYCGYKDEIRKRILEIDKKYEKKLRKVLTQ